MKQLLIVSVSVLAVLSMTEGLEITNMYACINKTNDLRIDCTYKTTVSGTIKYEWKLNNGKNTRVVVSTIHSNQIDASFKNRAQANFVDSSLRLTLTGFSNADDGAYTCHLHSETETVKDINKTIAVKHGHLLTCGAPGLMQDSPQVLILILSLGALHILGALSYGSQN
ncbi:thy-1 membrane glycoprotein-like [Chiloscyllium plagiosum]|uniref:thy-1 membrane glycoprotein-like n=1 Tax=Chiloscyllium plagiosum TaxID=36176 RepID=UPI001CB87122|nr:thy-1 membrane glycoprotein-like [Chiloscyllium plagiosum]